MISCIISFYVSCQQSFYKSRSFKRWKYYILRESKSLLLKVLENIKTLHVYLPGCHLLLPKLIQDLLALLKHIASNLTRGLATCFIYIIVLHSEVFPYQLESNKERGKCLIIITHALGLFKRSYYSLKLTSKVSVIKNITHRGLLNLGSEYSEIGNRYKDEILSY